MIKKAIKAIKNIFVPPIEYRNFEDDIECAIDENVVDCKDMDEEPPYTGVPAPVLNPVDDWFSSSYGCPTAITEKQKDYMEKETEMKLQEQKRREEAGEEPENIHQIMYEIATKNWNTVSETQGGSENFQEGPGGWNSGNGRGQFQK